MDRGDTVQHSHSNTIQIFICCSFSMSLISLFSVRRLPLILFFLWIANCYYSPPFTSTLDPAFRASPHHKWSMLTFRYMHSLYNLVIVTCPFVVALAIYGACPPSDLAVCVELVAPNRLVIKWLLVEAANQFANLNIYHYIRYRIGLCVLFLLRSVSI